MNTYKASGIERIQSIKGVKLAPFHKRAFAFILDFILLSAIFFLILWLFDPQLHTFSSIKKKKEFHFGFNTNWYSTLWMVLYFGLGTYWGKGKTPGKWAFGIRTISIVHERITLWHCIERALGYGLSFLEGGFGFFQYFINPDKRTLHDRTAETIVIIDRNKSYKTECKQ